MRRRLLLLVCLAFCLLLLGLASKLHERSPEPRFARIKEGVTLQQVEGILRDARPHDQHSQKGDAAHLFPSATPITLLWDVHDSVIAVTFDQDGRVIDKDLWKPGTRGAVTLPARPTWVEEIEEQMTPQRVSPKRTSTGTGPLK